MKRIYSDYAYGPGPRTNCWWDETIAAPAWPSVKDDLRVDVAVIGGGFTGISTALHLAESGVSVAVFEAQNPGWGASGRNGGFCCLGGAKLGSGSMARFFGQEATDCYFAGEAAAVDLASSLIDRFRINVDRHSQGETQLAHSARAMKSLEREAAQMEALGQDPKLVRKPELRQAGMNGNFHGAITRPEGFALNPRKYLFGLADAASKAGARLYQQSPVTRVQSIGRGYDLETPKGRVVADKLVIATNGYSSENIPNWLSGRYMPTQSTVMVTRPMTDAELDQQGWQSTQMAYDTRNLLHYFRLMPDRRFLFGMRGGLRSSPAAEGSIRRALRRNFERLFPGWAHVETTHCWSGMVCLSRNLVPFVGPVPDQPGLFAGLCYHGNGVAMGTYSGYLLSKLVLDQTPDVPYSPVLRKLPKFPLGPLRRLWMPPAYAVLGLMD